MKNFSFAAKYSLALSLIAIFSTLAFFNFSSIIETQEHDGEVINISGKQRMLSQKIALFSIRYKTKDLVENISLMESSHKKLLSLKMSQKLKALYFKQPIMLDAKVRAYIKEANKFSTTTDGRSLNYILNNSQKLLKYLDYAVSIYQEEAELRIQNLYKYELFILVLTLLTLTFEALFIFRPVDKSVKKYTKALIAEKEYSDMVTQTNTNAIIAVDEKFTIQTFNKSAQKMFGYNDAEMIGTTLLDDRIIPAKYLKPHISGLKTFMQKGELKNKNIVFELEGQTKERKIFPIRISFGTRVDGNKKIVVANIQNIKEQKDKDELITQQSRLAAMGEMIGNIAHQWRQPLSAISTIASGVKLRHKNNMIDDVELYESFDKIKEYTGHLSTTIDDFKNFFIEDKEKSVFSPIEVIKRSISLVEATYKSNKIIIYTKNADDKAQLQGNYSELSQVILNILNNAKDILVEQNSQEKVVLVESLTQDDFVYINIFDSAGGIPENIKMKIFEPYFTTKHKSQGTGIGLYMSNKIITQNFDGTLLASNEEFILDNKKYFGAKLSIKIKLA